MTGNRPAALRNPAAIYATGLLGMGYTDLYIFLIPLYGLSLGMNASQVGMLVVAAFQNPDPHRPGHLAVIRPSLKTAAELAREGPQETQAGATNALSTTIATGFRRHGGAWEPDGTGTIRYYAHAVDWNRMGVPGQR